MWTAASSLSTPPTGLPGRGSSATVRYLLAHASGLAFRDRVVQKSPGTRRMYSTAGIEVLAELVPQWQERVTELCRRLGMGHTEIWGSPGSEGRSTVRDLLRFCEEVLHPTTISPELAEQAATCQFPGLRGIVPGYGRLDPMDWGLGFQINGFPASGSGPDRLWFGDSMPADVIGHYGMAGTYLWVHRPTRTAAAILTDRPFGDWALPLWSQTNDALWRRCTGGLTPRPEADAPPIR